LSLLSSPLMMGWFAEPGTAGGGTDPHPSDSDPIRGVKLPRVAT
jgi:hypothetical protein